MECIGKQDVRNLVGMSLTDRLGGEEKGRGLDTVGGHCGRDYGYGGGERCMRANECPGLMVSIGGVEGVERQEECEEEERGEREKKQCLVEGWMKSHRKFNAERI